MRPRSGIDELHVQRIGVDEAVVSLGAVWVSSCSASGDAVSLREVQGGVDVGEFASACKRCPIQRIRTLRTCTPGWAARSLFGGIDHRWVDAVRQAAEHILARQLRNVIAAVMSRPTVGSARWEPSATPRPSTTRPARWCVGSSVWSVGDGRPADAATLMR